MPNVEEQYVERQEFGRTDFRSVCTSPKKFSSKAFFRLEKRCKSEGEKKKFFDENVFGEEVHNPDFRHRYLAEIHDMIHSFY